LLLNKDNKALYHLASVTVSNLVLSLINTGCTYLSQCGLSENDSLEALLPLIQNNINNIKNNGCMNALTGPVERNDIGTINLHLEVIPKSDVRLYKNLSLKLLPLSEKKHRDKDYALLKASLSEKGDY